jgi:hypothetical protein
VGPSQLPLAIVREDEEFILYRGEHSSRPGSRSILPLAATPNKAAPGKLEQEYSLRNELDPAWAARPVAMTKHGASSGGAADGLRHRFTLGAQAPVAAPAQNDSRLQHSRVSTRLRSFSIGRQENSIWRGLW